LLLGVFSYLFLDTKGLAYADLDSPSKLSYVKDLKSSGNNDNIAIELGAVFAIVAVGWGLLRLKKPLGWIDLAVQGLLLLLQTVYLATIEVGSIIDTLVLDKNLVFWLWTIFYLTLVILLAIRIVQKFRSSLSSNLTG
jgi:hypothetical protein